MSHTQMTMSLDHNQLGRLLKRREFGRFSDFNFRGRGDLNDSLQELASPALSCRTRKIKGIEGDKVYFDKGVCLKSPILARVLEPCEEAVFFIVTIGRGVEGEVARLNNEGRLTEAYILDRLGSLTAEHSVKAFYERMKRYHEKKGYGVTLRFSPGYCDWPITEQEKLFLLVDAESIGVTMTASCLMQPRKSVSGVFGLFPLSAHGKPFMYNPCRYCDNKDCNARRNCAS